MTSNASNVLFDTLDKETMFNSFCFMVMEEFLSKKGMINTLKCLREEWNRPSEETIMISWYEVALKLRLVEMLSQQSKKFTILENIVDTLIQDSSIRNRRPPEVLLTGLATIPRGTSLPNLKDSNTDQLDSPSPPYPSTRRPNSGSKFETSHIIQADSNGKHSKSKSNQITIKSKLDTIDRSSGVNFKSANKISSENWIPEQLRLKSIHRDIGVAFSSLDDIVKRETNIAREMKRLAISDLQRAQVEESLGSTKKIPCGCCLKKFLYVNLPLKVSRKAVLDIRIKWSGMLNSSNVFIASQHFEVNNPHPKKSSSPTKEMNELQNTNFDVEWKFYDEVGVCVFCAQFFDIQEEYRPSFQTITHQERKAAYLEDKRRQEEYWDPLKMCEKDREAIELRKQQNGESDESIENNGNE
eukprot:gene7730-10505_t